LDHNPVDNQSAFDRIWLPQEGNKVNEYSGMKQLAIVSAFSFRATYLISPDLDNAVGVLAGLIEGPSDVDCANVIPTLNEFFSLVVKNRPAILILDLSHVRWIEITCVPTMLEGCLRLKSLGTNVRFLEPIDCDMTDKVASAMRELYSTGTLLFGKGAQIRQVKAQGALAALLKIILGLVMYALAMKFISTELRHSISGGIRFATNLALAIGIGYLAKFLPIVNPQGGIQFFWSSEKAKTQSINEAAGVGVVVFFVALAF
jgi:hypothetical protein